MCEPRLVAAYRFLGAAPGPGTPWKRQFFHAQRRPSRHPAHRAGASRRPSQRVDVDRRQAFGRGLKRPSVSPRRSARCRASGACDVRRSSPPWHAHCPLHIRLPRPRAACCRPRGRSLPACSDPVGGLVSRQPIADAPDVAVRPADHAAAHPLGERGQVCPGDRSGPHERRCGNPVRLRACCPVGQASRLSLPVVGQASRLSCPHHHAVRLDSCRVLQNASSSPRLAQGVPDHFLPRPVRRLAGGNQDRHADVRIGWVAAVPDGAAVGRDRLLQNCALLGMTHVASKGRTGETPVPRQAEHWPLGQNKNRAEQDCRCGIAARHEDAVGHAGVEVHVAVERRAEAVQEGHGSEPWAGSTRCLGIMDDTGGREQGPLDLGQKDLCQGSDGPGAGRRGIRAIAWGWKPPTAARAPAG